jgi:hypothetical protein
MRSHVIVRSAKPARLPNDGASGESQSRAACSLVSFPAFRRHERAAEGLDKVSEKFKKLGGMTPALEKKIGF